VSVLVVNTPIWKVKAPDLARDVLKAYFSAPERRGAQAERAPPTGRPKAEPEGRQDLASR
jgi:hypothetical protein